MLIILKYNKISIRTNIISLPKSIVLVWILTKTINKGLFDDLLICWFDDRGLYWSDYLFSWDLRRAFRLFEIFWILALNWSYSLFDMYSRSEAIISKLVTSIRLPKANCVKWAWSLLPVRPEPSAILELTEIMALLTCDTNPNFSSSGNDLVMM